MSKRRILRKYYFLPKGCFYALDFWADNEREARAHIRSMLKTKTLHGVQVWKS